MDLSLRTSPLLRIDSLMHAREIAQLLMPLLILGIAAIYSTKTGDVTAVFDPLKLTHVTEGEPPESTDPLTGASEGEEEGLNKRKAILLGCWMLTLAITAAAAINK